MTAFMWAAFGLLACFVPIVLVVLLGREIDGVVALELGGTIATLLLLCLAQAFGRTSYFGLPIACAVTTWIGGLVFARFFGRVL
jgi:multisubunit Na+/H+ antiporter MnhF subunit